MLSENYQIALKNIRAAMQKAGRRENIEIIAASKTQPIDVIREAHSLGINVFGENRVQELTDKYTPDLVWDMIGQLQTNKVKYLIGKVRYIQSVDRLALAEAIDKEAAKKGLVQDVLIEINGGEEPEKGGVSPGDCLRFADTIDKFANINVKGIMAVMPNAADDNALRALYGNVAKVRAEFLSKYPSATVFSAGMSNDYQIAVEYGANLIRLGRALFGERK